MSIYISQILNVSSGVSVGGGGGLLWGVVSVNSNTESGNGYIVNTTSGQVTLTLPSTPSPGDQIGISDYNSGFEANNCIISRNGSNIMGLSNDFICDVNSMSIMLVYADASQGWKILSGIW